MKAELFCAAGCTLGEGPLWHPGRQRLFWFDIPEKTLLSTDASGCAPDRVVFDEAISAAGVVDDSRLLVATETKLVVLDIATGARTPYLPLEADRPETRSNDGRVGPHGIFWIGTMGWRGEDAPGAGAIYGVRGKECRVLQSPITIPNAICFAPDGATAYFTDTPTGRIMKLPLGEDGWPDGPPALFSDGAGAPGAPDGSVVDSDGYVWNARWGGSCVARFSPDGRLDGLIEIAARNVTCPAFGGADLATLYVTTARDGDDSPGAGHLYTAAPGVRGQAEIPVAITP